MMPASQSAGPRAVSTNQEGIYKDLESAVRKYMRTQYLRPIADHTREAFAQAVEFVCKFYGNAGRAWNEDRAVHAPYDVILDSGCGTGESTLNIAKKFPGAPVIGIDKSAARLTKAGGTASSDAGQLPPNAFLVRAELLDFWRLALEEVRTGRWHIPYHALYYPNPWPKQSEATRRFHLHPIFQTLLSLGDTIELRTNWEIYAQEFAEAVRVVREAPGAMPDHAIPTWKTITREAFEPEHAITAFERKYKNARQQLWRVVVNQT
ncbi:MAG: methyltransferase domain-containing protein [Fibrobacter sp.]|uniref:methyltransferase domain-containing protein n=1 Tax=Fibrobacter sp. TaxID=35828 RepID=UPI0025B7EAAF|nr:methyltransferase domain-containing protein [Fibrobacter sp.]MBR4784129.1 methyltransferase domain-containing protein [Fibrobacter sp.]